MRAPADYDAFGRDFLPGQLGILITDVSGDPVAVTARLAVSQGLKAPHGFLHGGAVVVLADTAAGYGCLANLPPDANGFTTVEIKSNHLGTAREGEVECVATPVHLGRSTQVWDARVRDVGKDRTIALFRCTQLLLYPDAAASSARAPVLVAEIAPADSVAARELVLDILNREYAMALTLEELPDLVDVHATYRASGAGNFWVARSGGRVVGCIGLLRLEGEDYELRRMYVDPAFRGLGLAQRLLDVLLAWASARGVRALFLETNEQWTAAHRIYERNGFVAVDRAALPASFPVVRVATGFYRRELGG